MLMRVLRTCSLAPVFGLALMIPGATWAENPDQPRGRVNPVPETRSDLKQALEDSKRAEPRLPLPPVREEELREGEERARSLVNNGRMRRHYLPPGFVSGGFPSREEPNMTLGHPFQTMLFWIVSRANNCTYCLGHQESKLAAAGISEDQVAALDGDWSVIVPANRAAFEVARVMTLTPHELRDEHIEMLREHYSEPQIAEILYVVSSFNAMNRWTGALNIPQEEHREYLTPTSDEAASTVTQVAPIGASSGSEGVRYASPQQRPPLESRDEVMSILMACRDRSPRVALIDAETTNELLAQHGLDLGTDDPPQWVRLLAYFPNVGLNRASILKAVEHEGSLDPLLRAQVAWVSARHDRAWYALAHAQKRLEAMDQSEEQMFGLDSDRSRLDEGDQLALAFAERLTVDPALVSDEEVEQLREHFGDHEVAELVAVVAEAVFFNQLTEAAGLPIE